MTRMGGCEGGHRGALAAKKGLHRGGGPTAALFDATPADSADTGRCRTRSAVEHVGGAGVFALGRSSVRAFCSRTTTSSSAVIARFSVAKFDIQETLATAAQQLRSWRR
jgi:predicted NBD/HSP70 family sugar kinase